MAKHMIRLQGRDFITYPGLMEKAHALGLAVMRTRIVQFPNAENNQTTIVEATVILRDPSTGLEKEFSGIGDANPQNVNRNIAPHSIRMAETRAKARALRDATGTEEASVEELADYSEPQADEPPQGKKPESKPSPQAAKPAPPTLATKGQVDEIGKEIKRLRWTPEKARDELKAKHGKSARIELTIEEAKAFIEYVRGLGTEQSEDDPMVRAVREAEQAGQGAA